MKYLISNTTTVRPLADKPTDLHVQVADRLTIHVHKVKLTEYERGERMVWVHGRHIRLDGQPGAHNRCHGWKLDQPMPALVADLVEDVKPEWGPITRA